MSAPDRDTDCRCELAGQGRYRPGWPGSLRCELQTTCRNWFHAQSRTTQQHPAAHHLQPGHRSVWQNRGTAHWPASLQVPRRCVERLGDCQSPWSHQTHRSRSPHPVRSSHAPCPRSYHRHCYATSGRELDPFVLRRKPHTQCVGCDSCVGDDGIRWDVGQGDKPLGIACRPVSGSSALSLSQIA